MVKQTNTSWSLSPVWNEALDNPKVREIEERDYIWASELGGSLYDRYMKLHGRTPTTPPNQRSYRKFSAGDLTEWIVMQMLKRAGVFTSTQDYIVNEEGPMKVTGRCDFIAGGKIKQVDMSDLPDSLSNIGETAVSQLKQMYPKGLASQILEIKSCSGTMFNRYERAPGPQHALQAFHYAYNLKLPAHIVYISRDDLRMVEWVILPGNERYKRLYFEDIQVMRDAYELPLKEAAETLREPLLTFEDDKFSKNWKVSYSNYLTDYGYERTDQYDDIAKSISGKLNRIIAKIKRNAPLTKVNANSLKECYEFYPEAKNIIEGIMK